MSSAETVKRIVEGTIRCLTAKGYAQTTISDIAAEAGVSRGALSHHFASKELLMMEVLNHILREKSSQIVQALPRPATLANVDFGIDEAFRAYTEQPLFILYFDLWSQSHWNDKLRQAIRAHFREVRHTLARIVDRDFTELGPLIDGDTIGLLFLTIIEGVALQYLTDPSSVDAARLLRGMKAAARMVFAGRRLDGAGRSTPRTPPRQS